MGYQLYSTYAKSEKKSFFNEGKEYSVGVKLSKDLKFKWKLLHFQFVWWTNALQGNQFPFVYIPPKKEKKNYNT